MDDQSDSIRAIKTTVHTLMAAGVDPMTIAVSLATLSVRVYKDITPSESITDHDMKMLFKGLASIGNQGG